jgi:thymidylate synthase ThyX
MSKTIKESLQESAELKTNFYTLADMKVEMLDYPANAYKTMVNMAMKTWGNKSDKWSDLTPQDRLTIVQMILNKKALPLATEHPKFSFSVDRIDRSSFDQLARARIGIVFASKGQKDDYLDDLGIIIPSRLMHTPLENEFKALAIECKKFYHYMKQYEIPNWARRSILPMYSEHSFIFSANFSTIQNLLAKRLETTEQEGVVAFSMLVREEIKKEYPLLANWLRPSCDFIHKDMTAAYNGFSKILSVPHASDNRHSGYDKEKYPPKWNEPCSDFQRIQADLNIEFPEPDEWYALYDFDDLKAKDKARFRQI